MATKSKKTGENQELKQNTIKLATPDIQEEKAADFLMWVGANNYPTVQDFVDEINLMGVCKRIGRVPKDLVIGKSRVFLAHDNGIAGEGFIFGYFVPTALEYVCDDDSQIPDHLRDQVEPVYDISKELRRRCGYRHQGSYLVNHKAEGSVVIFESYRPLNNFDPGRKRFRGMLKIDYGDKVIKARRGLVKPTIQPTVINDNPWTPKDDIVLLHCINDREEGTSISCAATKFALETGRTKNQVLYRYAKLSKKQ